jgi:hypothetical protein
MVFESKSRGEMDWQEEMSLWAVAAVEDEVVVVVVVVAVVTGGCSVFGPSALS